MYQLANHRLVKQAEKSVDEVLGKARDLMLQSRKNMAERINRGDATQNSKGNSADVWFTRAVTIWGARVADAQPPSWELYVSSNTYTSHREKYAESLRTFTHGHVGNDLCLKERVYY